MRRERRDQQRFDPTWLLIITCWSVVVFPRILQSFTASKHRASVDAGVPKSWIATQSERGLQVLLIAVCLWIIARRARQLPSDRRYPLLVMLAPWVFMIFRDVYLGTSPKIVALLYPFVIVAVWALRPRIERLSLLAWLVGATAALSIVMGALTPSRGIFTALTGDTITPTKQILPWGVLIGPFSDPNNLAQFLVLGLPAVALVPGWLRRALITCVTVTALVWTSSRSSLGAVAAGAVVSLVLAPLQPVTRRTISRGLLMLSAGAMIAIPLLTNSDTAYTNRGYIWRKGLRTFADDPGLGHGSAWYSVSGKFVNALGQLAFHGHNQFVHTLVTGGLVYLGLVGAMMAMLAYAASRWAQRDLAYPAIYLCMFFVSCLAEVSFGVVDRGFLLAVTVLPMAFFAFADRTPMMPVLKLNYAGRREAVRR